MTDGLGGHTPLGDGNDSLPVDSGQQGSVADFTPAPAGGDQHPAQAPVTRDESWIVPPDADEGMDGELDLSEFMDSEGTPPEGQAAPGQQSQTPPMGDQERIARFQQTQNPADLPEALKPVHETMLRGLNEKFRELAEREQARQREHMMAMQQLQQMQAQLQNPQEQPLRPEDLDPTSDSFYSDLSRLVDQQSQAKVAPVMQQLQQIRAQLEQTSRSAEEQRQNTIQQARVAALSRIPGHSPEIQEVMTQILAQDRDWQEMAMTNTGLHQLQAKAAQIVAEREQARQRAGHASTAAQRAVLPPQPAGNASRPVGGGAPQSYGDSLMDAARAAAQELGLSNLSL